MTEIAARGGVRSEPARTAVSSTLRYPVVGIAVSLLFLAICIPLIKTKPESWNDSSRVAAIESLVERSTWAIDDSPWAAQTADKVRLNGKFYSDKMPLLTALGASVYALLHSGFGASLAPDCAQAAKSCAYYWLALLLVAFPCSVLLGLLFQLAMRFGASIWDAVLGTVALAFGTMLWPYSLVLNHHVPAAVCLFASFYLLTQLRNCAGWLGAGFFAALAVSFDPLAGILAASLLGSARVGARSDVSYFVLGALLPLALTAWFDYQIAGTIVPPYLMTQGYDYPGSQFPTTIAGNGTADDLGRYAFRMFVGAQGLFGYNPILLFALAGLIVAAWRREHPLRVEAIFIALGFMLLSLYLVLQTGNYGGVAYGERWFVHAIPLVFAFVIFAPPFGISRGRIARVVIFAAALFLSTLSSYQGALHPWLYTPPPVQLTWKQATLEFGFKSNLQFPIR